MACLPSFWVLCPNSYSLVVMLYYLLLDVGANECVSRGAGDHIKSKLFHESPVNPEDPIHYYNSELSRLTSCRRLVVSKVNRRSFFF